MADITPISIDRLTLSPIKRPDGLYKIPPIWDYVQKDSSTIAVGHHYIRDLHHQLYSIRTLQFYHHTSRQQAGVLLTPLEDLIRFIQSCISAEDPEKVLLIHPPHNTSYASNLVTEIQERVDIRYVHVVLRSSRGSRPVSSSFTELGRDYNTAIVIDDGSNTGEMLMSLLATAAGAVEAAGRSGRVVICAGVTRMADHKIHLFQNFGQLRGGANVQFFFSAALRIPVFSRNSCPICRLRRRLHEIDEKACVLSHYATKLRVRLDGVSLSNVDTVGRVDNNLGDSQSPWTCPSIFDAMRLRESIEISEIEPNGDASLRDVLHAATSAHDPGPDDNDQAVGALWTLAFVVCLEPELLKRPTLVPFITSGPTSTPKALLIAIERRLKDAGDDEAATLCCFAFHLLVSLFRLHSTADSRPAALEIAARMWKTYFARSASDDTSENTASFENAASLGELCTILLAATYTYESPSRETAREVCNSFSRMLASISSQNNPIGRLYAMEMRDILLNPSSKSKIHLSSLDCDKNHLLELAKKTEGHFTSHSAEVQRRAIKDVKEVLYGVKREANDLQRAITYLVSEFCDLQELRGYLGQIMRHSQSELEMAFGAEMFWESKEVALYCKTYGQSLSGLFELITSRTTGSLSLIPLDDDLRTRIDELINTWPLLQQSVESAIKDLFPDLKSQIQRIWEDVIDEHRGSNDMQDRLFLSRCFRMSELPEVRVFLPSTLLHRFLRNAIENLGRHAFNNEASIAQASAVLSVRKGKGTVSIVIEDNGPELPHDGSVVQNGKTESGRGHSDLQRLIEPFGARVSWGVVGTKTEQLLTVCTKR